MDRLRLEKLRRLRLERYRQDPLAWLEERFGEDPKSFEWSDYEGYEKHEWDGSLNPLAEAWHAIADRKWVAIEAGVGTSKTYWASRLVFWFLDVFPDSLVVTSAPKQDQLKLHLWAEISRSFHKFKRIRPNSDLMKLRLKADGSIEKDEKVDNFDGEDLSESWQAVGFVAGTGADEEESATKAQGFHREDMLIVIEETPGMSPQVMEAFTQTSVAENNVICAMGNPDNELDPLHAFARKPDVEHIRVSAFDFPNVVLNKELIPGAVTRRSIVRRQVENGKNSSLYQSRVRGVSPAQSKDAIVTAKWIDNCVRQEDVENRVSKMKDRGKGYGIDVANSEDGDKAGAAVMDGPRLVHLADFVCPNATHLAYNVLDHDLDLEEGGYHVYYIPKAGDYGIPSEAIAVDATGVGVATVNAFYDRGFEVTSIQGRQWDEMIPQDNEGKPLYEFVSLRAQMIWMLREDIRQQTISFDIGDESTLRQLKEEILAHRFEMKSQKISIEDKEKVKQRLGGRSPNLFDAVVEANFIRRAKGTDYDLPMLGGSDN